MRWITRDSMIVWLVRIAWVDNRYCDRISLIRSYPGPGVEHHMNNDQPVAGQKSDPQPFPVASSVTDRLTRGH